MFFVFVLLMKTIRQVPGKLKLLLGILNKLNQQEGFHWVFYRGVFSATTTFSLKP